MGKIMETRFLNKESLISHYWNKGSPPQKKKNRIEGWYSKSRTVLEILHQAFIYSKVPCSRFISLLVTGLYHMPFEFRSVWMWFNLTLSS